MNLKVSYGEPHDRQLETKMGLIESLRVFGSRTVDRLHATRYHYLSNKNAAHALNQIEGQRGKLSTSLRKKADDYAVALLGGKVFAPWLYVYTALSGDFKEGWIPDNYYHLRVIPKIQGEYGKISFLKPLNHTIFKTSISPEIAFFLNGQWFDPYFSPIRKEVVESLSFPQNDKTNDQNKVVFKTDQSYQGRGVFVRNKDSFDVAELETKGNGTLQNYIVQHPFFTNLVSGSVANIRLTTVIDKGGTPDLRACYLRLGRTGDTHVKSNSHVRVPVDLGSGALYEEGYLRNWRMVRQHPDSMIRFSHKTIPGYVDCVRSVLNFHSSFPMVRAIGWDMAIDSENRPVLMEWNGYGNDIKFSEAIQGPCFKDMEWDRRKPQ